MADFVLAEGLGAASLRPLAEAAGVSDRMLLYYFTDKADAVTATLQLIALRMQTMMEANAPAERLPAPVLKAALLDQLFAPAFWPYMSVWLEIAALAARGEPLYRQVGEAIGRGFLAWGEAHLAGDDPATDAATLLVDLEGRVLLTALGLADVAKQAR
jgi:AcrR family transcriptional regulator